MNNSHHADGETAEEGEAGDSGNLGGGLWVVGHSFTGLTEAGGLGAACPEIHTFPDKDRFHRGHRGLTPRPLGEHKVCGASPPNVGFPKSVL